MNKHALCQSYTLEEELQLKRVVDHERTLNSKEAARLKSERRARLEAQQKVWYTRGAVWCRLRSCSCMPCRCCTLFLQLFEQRKQRTALEEKVQALEDAYFAGGVDALQQTLSSIGPTGATQRVRGCWRGATGRMHGMPTLTTLLLACAFGVSFFFSSSFLSTPCLWL